MKTLRLLIIVALALGVILTAGPAQAQDGREDGLVSCQEFATIMSISPPPFPGLALGSYGPFEEGVYTITVTPIVGGATVRLITDPSGATTLAGPATAPVTFTYLMPPVGSQPVGLGIIFDSVTPGPDQETVRIDVTVSCGSGGCDTAVPIPPDAVVGRMLDNAAAYWEPGQLITNPPVVLLVGKTFWVAGQDATGMFRKVLISCQWVWVEFDQIGPNYDEVWNGKPLPTTVVE